MNMIEGKAVAFVPRASRRMSKQAVAHLSDAIESLKDAGRCSSAALVETARDPMSPIHGYFEWDDQKAAALHRLTQARYYIRAISIEYVTAVVGIVQVSDCGHSYVDGAGQRWAPDSTLQLTDGEIEDDAYALLATARTELREFAVRYGALRAHGDAVALLSMIDAFVAGGGRDE